MLAYVGCTIFALDVIAAVALIAWPKPPIEATVRTFAAGVMLHLGWLVLATGTIGIYLARVYKDTIGLPLYVADQKHSTIPTKRHHE